MVNIKTSRQAFAVYIGMDISEVNEYRYHAGRTSIPVWAIDDAYYCVTKGNAKPAVHRDGMEWKWKERRDRLLNEAGYKVWESRDRSLKSETEYKNTKEWIEKFEGALEDAAADDDHLRRELHVNAIESQLNELRELVLEYELRHPYVRAAFRSDNDG